MARGSEREPEPVSLDPRRPDDEAQPDPGRLQGGGAAGPGGMGRVARRRSPGPHAGTIMRRR